MAAFLGRYTCCAFYVCLCGYVMVLVFEFSGSVFICLRCSLLWVVCR